MKAFHFHLDPALRWRATQLRLEQEAAARVAAQIAALEAELHARHSELRKGGVELVLAGSEAFGSWSAYSQRCQRLIRAADERLLQARKALCAQTQKVVQAHQRLRVMENLRATGHTEWTRDMNREAEAFAGEAFLAKVLRDRRTNDSHVRSR